MCAVPEAYAVAVERTKYVISISAREILLVKLVKLQFAYLCLVVL
jgi:hypothetical protein